MLTHIQILGIALLLFGGLSISSSNAADFHRTARYTLHTPKESPEQADLLSAVFETEFPAQVETVGAAIDYMLLRSGYRHISSGEITSTLSLPLPRSHRSMGPIDLRSALSVIVGDSWQLHEDSHRRIVWYQLAGSPPEQDPLPPPVSKQPEISVIAESTTDEVSWTLDKNLTLEENLRLWTNTVNWSLEWNSRHDYKIRHDSVYTGTLATAVNEVLEHFRTAPIPLTATFFSGNSVLVIEPQIRDFQ